MSQLTRVIYTYVRTLRVGIVLLYARVNCIKYLRHIPCLVRPPPPPPRPHLQVIYGRYAFYNTRYLNTSLVMTLLVRCVRSVRQIVV